MKAKLKSDLRDLTSLVTVSGSEQEAILYLKPRLEACCDKIEITGLGTVIAYKKGNGIGPRMIMTAHMDEIGFAVKNITQDGFIKFEKVGDFSNKMIPARKVWVQTKTGKVPGVIGMRAAHLLTAEEAIRAQSSRESYIDVGVVSRKEVEDMGVYIGSKIVIQSDFMEMNNPDIVCTKAIDDKLGCALVLNLLESIKKEDFNGEFIGVFSVMEETTIAGTLPIYNYLNADYVIALDTVPCGDVPDVDTESELPVYMGKGPVMIISQGDPTVLRYNSIHPRIRAIIEKVSSKININVQEVALSEKSYVTEESLAFMGGKGTPAATVAIPRRYSHTPTEMLNMNDAVMTYELLYNIVKQNGEMDLSFI